MESCDPNADDTDGLLWWIRGGDDAGDRQGLTDVDLLRFVMFRYARMRKTIPFEIQVLARTRVPGRDTLKRAYRRVVRVNMSVRQWTFSAEETPIKRTHPTKSALVELVRERELLVPTQGSIEAEIRGLSVIAIISRHAVAEDS